MSDSMPPFDPLEWVRVVAQLLGDIAWPVAFIVVFVALREEIVALLPGLRRLKGPGGFEAEFERGVEDAAEKVAALVGDDGTPDDGSGRAILIGIEGLSEGTSVANARPRLVRADSGTWDTVFSLSEASTGAAVVAAWILVEREIRSLGLHYLGVDSRTVGKVMSALVAAGVLREEEADLVMDLRQLRAEAMYGDEVTPALARRYVTMAKKVALFLEHRAQHPASDDPPTAPS